MERSTDNNNYIKTATITEPVSLFVQQSFSAFDDVSNVNSDIIYYRLKVIGKAGEIKYSNVLVVRKNRTQNEISVTPNPADNTITVTCYAEKNTKILIWLFDNAGKLIKQHTQKVFKGYNNIQLTDLHKFSNGMYILKIIVDDITTSKTLILKK